jgi:hypothetical protein
MVEIASGKSARFGSIAFLNRILQAFLRATRVVRAALADRGAPSGTSLIASFASDRPLALATLCLSVSVCVPMVVTPFLPLPDAAAHIGASTLMREAMFGHGLAAYHYKVNWAPVPYWTLYLLQGFGAWIVGPLAAAKITVGLVIVGMPLATMRLLTALGRDPRLGLWAFALSWEHNLYAGWISFLMGMALALVAAAWLIEAKTFRDALKIAALSALIAVTHAQAVVYLAIVSLFLLRAFNSSRTRVPSRHRFRSRCMGRPTS